MPNPYFKFKQFTIFHDQCAMKVGTDAVLLGAWACKKPKESINKILDIGSGSGLISLMMAQRFDKAQVHGVEIEESCFEQSRNNVSESPFSDRIHLSLGSIQEYHPFEDLLFDVIVSNPPFFSNGYNIHDSTRDLARNNENLTFHHLWDAVDRLSHPETIFSVIIPINEGNDLMQIGLTLNWHVIRICEVSGSPTSKPKRLLIEFSKQHLEVRNTTLVLEQERGVKTDAYKKLTQDFYLDL